MKEDCPFCEPAGIIESNLLAIAIYDNYPVTFGHALVIPRRHVKTIFDLTCQELIDVWDLVRTMKNLISKDKLVKGFNIGVNCEEVAGQTVPHCHIHVIPRRIGDMEDPTGGVRGVIPEKQKYERR